MNLIFMKNSCQAISQLQMYYNHEVPLLPINKYSYVYNIFIQNTNHVDNLAIQYNVETVRK